VQVLVERVLEQIHLHQKVQVLMTLSLGLVYQEAFIVRATGHKTPGESSVNITVSVYDTTHLQENPQRIG